MKAFVPLEEYKTFLAATRRAKAIAMKHKHQTGVRRSLNGWEVLVPTRTAVNLDSQSLIDVDFETYGSSCYLDDSDYTDYGYDRELEQVMDDVASDRDDWERSEEEGWYYSDDY